MEGVVAAPEAVARNEIDRGAIAKMVMKLFEHWQLKIGRAHV